MTNLADRTIAALRATHDDLAALVPELSLDQLNGPSGAAEWTVAQVLSHLGSGAEISLASYGAAIDAAPDPGPDFNQSVWDRWNAMGPQEQAAGYLVADAKLVERLEALTPEQREALQIKLGFLPSPLPLASIAGMRLSEAAQHAWDVHAGLARGATLPVESAEIMAEQLSGGLSFMPGFFGKPEALKIPAVVAIEDTDFGFVIGNEVAFTSSPTNPTATFVGPLEAAIRLLGGRLKPEFTAPGIEVTGSITLDDLRRVFPGF